MKEGHIGRGDRGLVVTLCILLVMIVGLSVGLGVVIANKNRAEEIAEEQQEQRIEDTIVEYQEKINTAANEEEKAELYEDRAFEIFNDGGTCSEYGQQILEDIIAADVILKTPDSAGQVVNVAMSCGDEELAEKYMRIISDRKAALGVDENMETRG